MRKRILLLLLFLIGGMALIGCKDPVETTETFKLTLPQEVTSNQTNPEKVLKDANVVLTVVVPVGQEVESFKVDGVEKKDELVNNKLSFKMTKDIVVTVSFKDVEGLTTFKLTLPSGVTANVDDLTAIPENTSVELTVAVPEGKEVESFKVDGVEKKGALVNNKLTVQMTKDITVTVSFKDVVVYYKLTLPAEVTANVDNPDEVASGTEVELTVVVPDQHKIVTFTVDGVDKLASLVNNKLTITMSKNIVVAVTFESLAPQMVGQLVDWMPGATADTTGLVATFVAPDVVFNELTGEGIDVYINASKLEYLVDYDIEDDTLTVFGQALEDENLALGEHSLKITTVHGTASIPFNVVNDPVGTSIPTTTIKGFDMREIASYPITEPIAGAPELLITEINFDLGVYEHIEVFNNTTEPYNLKGHRIVFADLTKQKVELAGIFHEPLGMYSSVYIDEDLIIPALSPAILWIVNGRPWNVETTGSPRKVVETEDAKNYLFEGVTGGKLTIAAFREGFGIAESIPVFPLRPHYMLARTDNGWNYEAGVGLTIAKGANWSGNSGMDDRGVQIQKISNEKFSVDLIDASAAGAIPVGATHFSYEFKIFNKENEVYTDGVLDSTKMIHNGARESVNSLALRMRFYDAEGTDLGLALTGNAHTGFDIYNANFASYVTFVERAVTPIVTAFIYQNIDGGEYAASDKRWPERVSMQYTIPNPDASGHYKTLMRFVVPQSEFTYQDWYLPTDSLKDIKLLGVSSVVASEIFMDKDIIVPVDPGYPTTYLNNCGHTAGVVAWYNLLTTQPE